MVPSVLIGGVNHLLLAVLPRSICTMVDWPYPLHCSVLHLRQDQTMSWLAQCDSSFASLLDTCKMRLIHLLRITNQLRTKCGTRQYSRSPSRGKRTLMHSFADRQLARAFDKMEMPLSSSNLMRSMDDCMSARSTNLGCSTNDYAPSPLLSWAIVLYM